MGESAKSLLIVDDDPLVGKTYQHCFETVGYKVAVFNNGNGGIAYMKNHHVDAVLLDIFMPDKEGLETLLEMKKLFPATRVIVMSGGGSSPRHDFLAIATKFGADGVVRKPVSPLEIAAMIENDPLRTAAGR